MLSRSEWSASSWHLSNPRLNWDHLYFLIPELLKCFCGANPSNNTCILTYFITPTEAFNRVSVHDIKTALTITRTLLCLNLVPRDLNFKVHKQNFRSWTYLHFFVGQVDRGISRLSFKKRCYVTQEISRKARSYVKSWHFWAPHRL